MKRRRRSRPHPGWALGASLALGGLACSESPQGQLVLVLTTDMAIPKDIDAIDVEILGDGERQYRGGYDFASGNLKLPGTVGILSRVVEQEIEVRVTARSGDDVRLERTVVTKMPVDRVAMLEAPLEWLCTDRARRCDSGQTCSSGRCVFSRVASGSLPTYVEEEVFGGGDSTGEGGACFDAIGCFTGAIEVPLPPEVGSECTLSVPGDAQITNVALRTERDGICGPAGCLVPLNQGRVGDWIRVAGAGEGETQITLPAGVCKEERRPRVFGVVLSTRCAPKTQRRPACGPWSPVGGGDEPDPGVPVTLAGDQRHPRSLAVAGGSVFWTSTGEQQDGTVKSVSRDGRALTTLASKQGSPSGLVLELAGTTPQTVWWVNDDNGRITKVPVAGGVPAPVEQWPGARSGLAADDGCIYFTTSVGQVICIAKDDSGQRLVAEYEGDATSIAADGENVYWISRGESRVITAPKNGGEARPSPAQASPVAIVADAEGVYWVNAGTSAGGYADGAVIRLRPGGEAPETMRSALKLPAAIAIDSTSVYWTNKGDGTVMKMPRSGDGDPRTVASGQKNPIAIVVDDTYVYWANAGTAERKYTDGAILRVAKH